MTQDAVTETKVSFEHSQNTVTTQTLNTTKDYAVQLPQMYVPEILIRPIHTAAVECTGYKHITREHVYRALYVGTTFVSTIAK